MMRQHKRLAVASLIVASLQLIACGSAESVTALKPQPAKVDPILGTDLHTIVLIPDAARRLDIQTAAARDMVVERKRIVGGEVFDSGGILSVRVPLSAGDLSKVDRSRPAMILPLARTADAVAVKGKVTLPPDDEDTQADLALFYSVEGTAHKLEAGQRVRVELTLAGHGAQRRVIPYSAVIYDLDGETWVYTSPKPLTFVRERIVVDHIADDVAVLSEGLSLGTEIVTVGAAELYGTEFGVGH